MIDFTEILTEPRFTRRRKSVERWRRAWREGGMEALRSAGPANSPTVTDAQFAVLEEELGKGPSAHGFEDERPCQCQSRSIKRK